MEFGSFAGSVIRVWLWSCFVPVIRRWWCGGIWVRVWRWDFSVSIEIVGVGNFRVAVVPSKSLMKTL